MKKDKTTYELYSFPWLLLLLSFYQMDWMSSFLCWAWTSMWCSLCCSLYVPPHFSSKCEWVLLLLYFISFLIIISLLSCALCHFYLNFFPLSTHLCVYIYNIQNVTPFWFRSTELHTDSVNLYHFYISINICVNVYNFFLIWFFPHFLLVCLCRSNTNTVFVLWI